jgi:glutamyl/glutaminyl-tRNA synthetase
MEGYMADTKDQVIQTEIVEETTDNQAASQVYGFTQDQVDEVVAKRLAREREAVAKKLGIDKYEAVDSFLESYQNTVSEKETLVAELSLTKESLVDKEFRLTALSAGVKPEYLDRAVKLARTELTDKVTIEQALEVVLEDFPMLKGGEQPVRKVGAETRNEVAEKTDIDRYLDKYKGSKYFQK